MFQLNKRDLPNALSVEELHAALDPNRIHQTVEASAVAGKGVFESVKGISKLTLKNLRTRMMGDDAVAEVKVRENGLEADASRPTPAAPEPEAPAPPPVQPAPEPQPAPAPPAASIAVEPTPPEVAQPLAAPEPEVKTVKVRSSIDVMAELDALRKKATQGKKRRERAPGAAGAVASSFAVDARDLDTTRQIRVIVQVEDADGAVLRTTENLTDVADQRDQVISIKIDLGADE